METLDRTCNAPDPGGAVKEWEEAGIANTVQIWRVRAVLAKAHPPGTRDVVEVRFACRGFAGHR